MEEVKPFSTEAPAGAKVVAALGDIVGSRAAAQRVRLHETLVSALDSVNAAVPSVRPLRVTVGDEFQGVYDRLGDAIDATLRVRLALLPEVDIRYGIGIGAVQVIDPDTGIEDGPGWWRARAAIEHTEQLADRAATRLVRTTVQAAEEENELASAVTAALTCRDHMIGSLSDRSLRLLRGLLEQSSQTELAKAEGISDSAVSQRVRNDGLGIIVDTHDLLRELS